MRGVIEIRKEGQGKVIEHVEAFPTQTGRSVMDTFFSFWKATKGYFHCSHPLSLLCLSLSRLTSLVTPGYHMLLRNFGLHGLIWLHLPILPPSRKPILHGLFVSAPLSAATGQLHTVCSSELVGERIWLICLRSGVDFFVPPFSDQAEGRLTRFLVFSS